MKRLIALLLFPVAMSFSVHASAQDRELPYWASISAEEANMRSGAGEVFPIEWVYSRPGLPVKVIRSYQGWRYVEEIDGTQGWIYSGLLSAQRTAMITGEGLAAMRASASANAPLRWNLEPGVIGNLGDCDEGWCEFDVGGRQGFVAQDRLWGAGEP